MKNERKGEEGGGRGKHRQRNKEKTEWFKIVYIKRN